MRKVEVQEIVPEEVCSHHILLSSLLFDKQFIIYFQEDLKELLNSPFTDNNCFPFKVIEHNKNTYVLTELTSWLILVLHGNPVFSYLPWGDITIVDEWFGAEILPGLSEFIIDESTERIEKSFLSYDSGYWPTLKYFSGNNLSECKLKLLELNLGVTPSEMLKLMEDPKWEKTTKEKLKVKYETNLEKNKQTFMGIVNKISQLRIQCS